MTKGSDWSGRVGDVWAAEARRTDRSFAGLAPHLDAVIADATVPRACVVDIGCGAGATGRTLATARSDVSVVGVDLSAPLVDVARGRSDLPNLRYVEGDVLRIAAALRPDLYVSRHGIMFFDDPVVAFARLGHAANEGARMVFSCFAERAANRWAAEPISALGGDGDAPAGDAPGPFAFVDPHRVASILREAGWRSGQPRRVDFRYVAGAGDDPVGDALGFLQRIGPAAPMLRDAPSDDRPALIERLRAVCAGNRHGGEVTFAAVAWIWSATFVG